MIQTLEKIGEKSCGILILAFAVIALCSCAQPDGHWGWKPTGKISIEGKQELAVFGNVLAKAAANAVAVGAADVAGQFITTGKVDTKQLQAAELSGLAANLQGYVGQVVDTQILIAGAYNPAVAARVAAATPKTVEVTQQGVDALYAQAEKLSPNAGTP